MCKATAQAHIVTLEVKLYFAEYLNCCLLQEFTTAHCKQVNNVVNTKLLTVPKTI